MSTKVPDVEYGPTTFPRPPSKEEYERVGSHAMASMRRRRLWPANTVSACPVCQRKAFAGRDDLVYRVARPGGVLVFHRLRGGRCQACGAQALEPGDLATIEEQAAVELVADFEAKVSRIGSGSLGTYWPRDVVRNMDLAPNRRAFIQVLDKDTLLVRFVRPKAGTTKARRRVRRKPKNAHS